MTGECSGRRYNRGCRCDLCTAQNREKQRSSRAKRKAVVTVSTFKHGASGYTNWDCRCDICVAANSEKCAANYEARKSGQASPTPHGTKSGYGSFGCRCDDCRAAMSEYNRGRGHSYESQRVANEFSRDGAHHHRDVWTGPELEFLASTDMCIRDIAAVLGRTIAACRTMRKKLSVDPRKQALAGIAMYQEDPGQ